MGQSILNIAVLGSTGSVGQQTLDIVRAFPERLRIVALAAGQNQALLATQIREFQPGYFASLSPLAQESSALPLSLEDIASHPEVNTVVIATSGRGALKALINALKSGKTVALANKETMVMAGNLVRQALTQGKGRLFPVDSEHSAIWQCLRGETIPARLILTASGGPFRDLTPTEMTQITPEQALNHPSWKMGAKITVDSATLMNKGLEVIEAHYLFDIPYDQINVMIHPESIIHAMVEFNDGSVKALASNPDMRFPIQYALSYPERWSNPSLPSLKWSKLSALHFTPPDEAAFPCLRLARQAGMQGGTYPAALCGADEAAVRLFLMRRIRFTDIFHLVDQVLAVHHSVSCPDIEQVLATHSWSYDHLMALTGGGL
jgi:1-deoxy-D-xylulose-5-phosphate reductoisomerase